jgi:hypothetical protein
MTAIGRRLARRTGTVSTRNGGDVMATVCVWLSTLAGSRSGRPVAWMVGARYHPDSPTPARVASGWKAPYGRPPALHRAPRSARGMGRAPGDRGQVATDVANHLRLRPSWQPCARSVSHAARATWADRRLRVGSPLTRTRLLRPANGRASSEPPIVEGDRPPLPWPGMGHAESQAVARATRLY